MNFVFVAAGGALGAILRYSAGFLPFKANFPLSTLMVNFIGAFIIGLITGIAEEKGMSENGLLFLKTGFCGGFTTFSTFSIETVGLIDSGRYSAAGLYIILSLVLCLAGAAAGKGLKAFL